MALPKKRTSTYRADIDGIRGLAILSVVLYHAGVSWLTGGFSGVDVFFVLSGYLIGGHIFAELSGDTFSFARFYQRRAKRILPAFYVVLTAVLLLGLLLLSPLELKELSTSSIAAVFSASNIHFLRYSDYFQQSSELNPLLMTWSLAVEEQFYLVVPLLMVAVAKLRSRLILPTILAVCAISFVFAWHQVHTAPGHAFYLLPSRAWELGVGVALGVAEITRKGPLIPQRFTTVTSFCGFAAMVVPLFLLNSSTPFPGPSAASSVFGTALVLSTPSSWINRRLFSEPRLVFVGRISYSWYLWHWPLLSLLRVASGGPLPWVARVTAVVLSFVLALASYAWIEQVFRRSKSAPRPLLIRYGVLSLALALILTTVWKSDGLPRRFPALQHEQAEAQPECLVPYGKNRPDLSQQCTPAIDQRPSIALWGDSHSSALAPAMRSHASAHDLRFVEFSKSSCLPLSGVAKYVASHPLVVQECVDFNRVVLKTILDDRTIQTVFLAGRWADPFVTGNHAPLLRTSLSYADGGQTAVDEARVLSAGLAAPISLLQAAGRRVILIEDVPNFDFDPLSRMRSEQIPLRSVLARWLSNGRYTPGMAHASFLDATDQSDVVLQQVQKRFPATSLLDLRPMLCDGQGLCAYKHGGHLLYSDGQHLTSDGAFYALRNFDTSTP